MSVAMLAADGRYLDLGGHPPGELLEDFHALVEFGIMASQRQAVDPIDRAIVAMLRVRNPALWWVTGGAVTFLALTVSLPAARALFRFSPV